MECSRLVVLIIIANMYGFFTTAKVTFGSQDSAIRVSGKGTLKVSTSNLSIDGTISKDGAGSIIGQPIDFSNGVLELSGKPVALSASYVPAKAVNTTHISLKGNNYVRVEPGAVIAKISVEGSNNLLEGAPMFEKAIMLANASSELTLALLNKLNKNIELSKGVLILENDLALIDNVFIKGPGTIKPNGRNLLLGANYTTPWNTELTFNGATGIYLHGDVSLDYLWRFSGVNKINGNGTTLRLVNKLSSDGSNNSRFIVASKGSLSLTDVYLKNVRNDMIVLQERSDDVTVGKVYLSHVTMELNSDVTINAGDVIIACPTTILLNGHTLSFIGSGIIKVQDRLYLDKRGISGGDLLVGTASLSNQTAGSSGVNYIVDASAVVTEITGDGKGISSVSVSEGKSATQVLGLDVALPVDNAINVVDDVTIDGQGTSLTFHTLTHDRMRTKNARKSQFVVQADNHVTLKNITLSRLTSRTFDLQEVYDPMTKEAVKRGSLCLDANVVLELEEDTVISKGFIKVNDKMRGNVVVIRGINGKKKLILHPETKLPKNAYMVDLGSASLKLENVELIGLQNIRYDAAKGASIVLGGGATVNAVATNNDINDPIIDLNFDIEGVNNELVVRNDALCFAGSIAFLGYASTNFLRICCSPLYLLPDTHPAKQDVDADVPLVRFSGNPGIYLSTDNSATGVEFVDRNAFIKLEHPNAFVVTGVPDSFGSAFLKAKHLHVSGHPIRQVVPNFVVDVDTLVGFID